MLICTLQQLTNRYNAWERHGVINIRPHCKPHRFVLPAYLCVLCRPATGKLAQQGPKYVAYPFAFQYRIHTTQQHTMSDMLRTSHQLHVTVIELIYSVASGVRHTESIHLFITVL